jgi:preprotein translocase subunit YajC
VSVIAASGGGGGGLGIFPILILGFLILYLVVVRPRQRRQNQERQRISELRVGDEVITAGGIYGSITGLDDDYVTVKIAPNLEVRVARRAIAGVTSEPEPEEPPDTEEPQDGESGERWRSAFDSDDEDSTREASNHEKRG